MGGRGLGTVSSDPGLSKDRRGSVDGVASYRSIMDEVRLVACVYGHRVDTSPTTVGDEGVVADGGTVRGPLTDGEEVNHHVPTRPTGPVKRKGSTVVTEAQRKVGVRTVPRSRVTTGVRVSFGGRLLFPVCTWNRVQDLGDTLVSGALVEEVHLTASVYKGPRRKVFLKTEPGAGEEVPIPLGGPSVVERGVPRGLIDDHFLLDFD